MAQSNYMQKILEKTSCRPKRERVLRFQRTEEKGEEELSKWMKRAETIEKQMCYLKLYGRRTQAEQAEKLLIHARRRIEELKAQSEPDEKEAPQESQDNEKLPSEQNCNNEKEAPQESQGSLPQEDKGSGS